jgi:hypothetical protein
MRSDYAKKLGAVRIWLFGAAAVVTVIFVLLRR